MAIVSPPFQVPDEPAHFYRAYHISTGRLIAEDRDGIFGSDMPSNLKAFEIAAIADLPGHPDRKLTREQILSFARIPLAPERKDFIGFNNTAVYPPLTYLPQSIGILVGRLFGLPPLILLYCGRLSSLIFWIACATLAIRIIPTGKHILFLLALMPMTIYQTASVSADGPTTAVAYLLIALSVAASATTSPFRTREYATILCVSLCLALCKPSYILLILLWFGVPVKRFGSGKRYLAATAGYLVPVISASAAWMLLNRHITHIDPACDTSGQVALLLHHPVSFLHIILNNMMLHAEGYAVSFVGFFGWLDTPLALKFVYSYLLLILFICLRVSPDESIPDCRRRFLYFSCFALIFLMIVTILFVYCAQGAQGRYFIPIAPLLFLTFQYPLIRLPVSEKTVLQCLTGVAVFSFGYALFKLITRFYTLPP